MRGLQPSPRPRVRRPLQQVGAHQHGRALRHLPGAQLRVPAGAAAHHEGGRHQAKGLPHDRVHVPEGTPSGGGITVGVARLPGGHLRSHSRSEALKLRVKTKQGFGSASAAPSKRPCPPHLSPRGHAQRRCLIDSLTALLASPAILHSNMNSQRGSPTVYFILTFPCSLPPSPPRSLTHLSCGRSPLSGHLSAPTTRSTSSAALRCSSGCNASITHTQVRRMAEVS